MDIWRYGDMEIWRYYIRGGLLDVQSYGDMEIAIFYCCHILFLVVHQEALVFFHLRSIITIAMHITVHHTNNKPYNFLYISLYLYIYLYISTSTSTSISTSTHPHLLLQ